MKGSLVVLQSGGPTCVINSSLYGVIKQAQKEENITNIYGSLNGIDGIIEDDLIDLNKETEEELENLLVTPGAALGSTRHRLPKEFDSEIYQKILACFKKYNIRYFLLNGGNDSMDTANKVSEFFKQSSYECVIMGIPKTIDNDLSIIDHTPGYGSAAKYIANTFAELSADISCYKKGKVTIVEVMGRDAGWLTAASKLACLTGHGPDLIYLPEITFSTDRFLEKVSEVYKEKQNVLIAVSEGVKDEKGTYIVEKLSSEKEKDAFGHAQLSGTGKALEELVSSKLKLPTRSIELSLLQRCPSHIASLTDILEASNCGAHAVKFAVQGVSGEMVIMERKSDVPYEITYTHYPLSAIANEVKTVPVEWIVNECDISQEFIKYCLPLINGETKYKYENGLPRFVKLAKIKAK